MIIPRAHVRSYNERPRLLGKETRAFLLRALRRSRYDRFFPLGMGFSCPMRQARAGRGLVGAVYQLVDGAEGEGRQCLLRWELIARTCRETKTQRLPRKEV